MSICDAMNSTIYITRYIGALKMLIQRTSAFGNAEEQSKQFLCFLCLKPRNDILSKCIFQLSRIVYLRGGVRHDEKYAKEIGLLL